MRYPFCWPHFFVPLPCFRLSAFLIIRHRILFRFRDILFLFSRALLNCITELPYLWSWGPSSNFDQPLLPVPIGSKRKGIHSSRSTAFGRCRTCYYFTEDLPSSRSLHRFSHLLGKLGNFLSPPPSYRLRLLLLSLLLRSAVHYPCRHLLSALLLL